VLTVLFLTIFLYKFTIIDEERMIGNVKAINKFIENTEKDVSFMIVPNSYEIYREKLPTGAPLINQQVEINKIYQGTEGSNNIDLLKVMSLNKEDYIYYKTDLFQIVVQSVIIFDFSLCYSLNYLLIHSFRSL